MVPEKIKLVKGRLVVPDNPIIPFIEGDGTGPDIWSASVRIFDAAVEKTFKGEKKVAWKEVLAGEKAFSTTGNWMKLWKHSVITLLE
jgi:isocitrate dehydrogenase